MVTSTMNESLCSPILDVEIEEAVFNIGGGKLRDRMGFKVSFFNPFGT